MIGQTDRQTNKQTPKQTNRNNNFIYIDRNLVARVPTTEYPGRLISRKTTVTDNYLIRRLAQKF